MNIIKEEYIFTEQSHDIFLDSSKDYNPIHADTDYIKNTLLEDINIHGTHILLKTLDVLLKNNILINHINMKFINSIYRNELICLSLNLQNQTIIIESDKKICVKINYQPANELMLPDMKIVYDKPKYKQSRLLSFDDVSVINNQKFNIIENSSDLVNLYPKLIKAYNKLFLSELCSISYLVGMECPGLHSIEGALSISMKREYHNNITPKFSVSFTDKRFNYIVIKVESFSFVANVEVIYRI